MKKYWTVALLGWQDSMVYRFNALIWVAYAVVPSLTLILVWLAAYERNGAARIGGFDLNGMITYYLCVTALTVVITPHPEWEMAQLIRDGKITGFIVRPIGFYGYRLVQETAYQIVKTGMMLPAFAILIWIFRAYLQLPPFDPARTAWFILSVLLAYGLLTQIKFLLGISAFWLAEPGGFLEIWNVLTGVFGGRLLPLSLLPSWVRVVSEVTPFGSLYAFPMQILMARATSADLVHGFLLQVGWLAMLSLLVRVAWRRGLLVYEAYGG